MKLGSVVISRLRSGSLQLGLVLILAGTLGLAGCAQKKAEEAIPVPDIEPVPAETESTGTPQESKGQTETSGGAASDSAAVPNVDRQ